MQARPQGPQIEPTNNIHHGDWLANAMPDKSVQLIIADPPYFEVKGDFDFIWGSFEEYLVDVEKWAIECKRLLAENGTLLWYGHAKKIAYSQIIFDKYFNLENSLVWRKTECQTMQQEFEQARCFAPVTERILMYSNYSEGENDWKNNNATVYFSGFEKFRLYFRSEIAKVGTKKAAEHCGISSRAIGHWTCKSQWCFPAEANIEKLKELGLFKEFEAVGKDFESVRKEFEAVRKEFGTNHRRCFDNFKKLHDVLGFSQEAHITKKYAHDTCKPETLTRALILTCSRPNDLVFVPFSGSGTEVAMALKEGRNAIGFDIELEYVDMGNKRANIIKAQQSLF